MHNATIGLIGHVATKLSDGEQNTAAEGSHHCDRESSDLATQLNLYFGVILLWRMLTLYQAPKSNGLVDGRIPTAMTLPIPSLEVCEDRVLGDVDRAALAT